MKYLNSVFIFLGVALAMELSFPQLFADEAPALSDQEKIEKLALEKKIKFEGYDRIAYQEKLKTLSEGELSMEKTGPYLKSVFACIGTGLADGAVGIVESIPILNMFIKESATGDEVSFTDDGTYGPYDPLHRAGDIRVLSIFAGVATIPIETIYHGIGLAGSAAIGYETGVEYNKGFIEMTPRETYLGTRIYHEKITRAFGCRQSLSKLEDIENELNSRRQ